MNSYLKIVVLFLAYSFTGCGETPLGVERGWRFWIQNESSNGIAFNIGITYPDTTIIFTEKSLKGCPVDERVPFDINKPWKEYFKELPRDTLNVYVFSSDTLQKYDWETIVSESKVLERYDLSYQDMIEMNWILIHN